MKVKRGSLRRLEGGEWKKLEVEAKIKVHAHIRFSGEEKGVSVSSVEPSQTDETALEIRGRGKRHQDPVQVRAASRKERDAWVDFLRRSRAKKKKKKAGEEKPTAPRPRPATAEAKLSEPAAPSPAPPSQAPPAPAQSEASVDPPKTPEKSPRLSAGLGNGSNIRSMGSLPFLTPQPRRSRHGLAASSSLAAEIEVIETQKPPQSQQQQQQQQADQKAAASNPGTYTLRRTHSDETGNTWSAVVLDEDERRRRKKGKGRMWIQPVLLGSAIKEWRMEHADEPIANVGKKWRNSQKFELGVAGAKEEKGHLHHRRKKRMAQQFKVNEMGEVIYKNHPSWVLMHQMQIGIRHCIATERLTEDEVALLKTPSHWLREEFFATPPIIKFPAAGSQDTVKHSMGDFKFKDYNPLAFRHLRAIWGIDRADFLESLCHSTDRGENPLRLMGTPGKSGSLFFFSQDMRYIIKTIPKDEARLLRSILKPYVTHVSRTPNTLLPRFYGLYRVKPHHGNQVRFIIMANLFATSLKIHERFDLKGSLLGRYVTPAERAAKGPNVTLKEANLKELGRVFRIGSDRRDKLLEQLEADTAMLQDLGIMDYSLLVGVHYVHPPPDVFPHSASLNPFAAVTSFTPSSPATSFPSLSSPAGAGTSASASTPTVAPAATAAKAASSAPKPAAAKPEFLSMTLDLQPQAATVTHAGDTDIVSLSQPLQLTTSEHEDLKPAKMPTSIWSQEDGGVWARDPSGRQRLEECYFLGIIDILMFYTVRKAAERVYKTLRFRGQGEVSSCPPNRYAKRFVRYLANVIV